MAPTQSPISRKRKAVAAAGPLVLAGDVQLGDNELVEVVIEVAKSKPQEIMLGVDKELHKDFGLQSLSDSELASKISRAENMLGTPSMFPDGGAKLRVLLKKQVAEMERIKLLKGKRAKATLLAQDKPIRIDAINDLSSRGTSPSVPASQSFFASHFRSKLDDKGPAKTFANEMSRTQKIGLSSSHTAFKSPSNLSDHTNDSSQPNRGNFGHFSSTPSHRQPDKGVSGYFEKNKLGDKVQLPTSYLLDSLEDMGPILETMTISEQAQFGTALLGRALDAFVSARGGFLQLEAENKKLTQHNSVLVKDNKSFHAEVNSLKSALVAQTARDELAQAERDSWLKEKDELIAAHKAELDAVKEKSRAEGYEQGQDELKGLQRLFYVKRITKLEEE